MNILGGYEDFMDIFWGHRTIGLYLGVIICILGSFLKVKVQNGDIFWGYENFKYFLRVLKIPDIFWG